MRDHACGRLLKCILLLILFSWSIESMTVSFKPSITRILIELGETNMRCAILDHGDMHDIKVYAIRDFPSMAAAIDGYCQDIHFKREAQMGLLMAIAPQIKDGIYHFKHTPSWDFRPRDLIKELGLASVHILNDLESHAWAVMGGAHLDGAVTVINEGLIRNDHPIAVIAPGTGLGFAYVYPHLNYVQETFGGHMHFHGLGNKDPHFDAIQGALLFPYTTFEDIVSGPGLALLREKIGVETADRYFNQVFGLFIHHCFMFGHALGGIIITGGLMPALMQEGRVNWALIKSQYHIENIAAVNQAIDNIPLRVIDDPYLGLKGLIAWAQARALSSGE